MLPPDTAQMTNVRWNLFHIFLVIPVSLLKALAKKSAMFEDLVLLELEGDAAHGQQVRGERGSRCGDSAGAQQVRGGRREGCTQPPRPEFPPPDPLPPLLHLLPTAQADAAEPGGAANEQGVVKLHTAPSS